MSLELYGPWLEGEFAFVAVEDVELGAVIPSHDGRWHTIDAKADEDADGQIELTIRRSADRGAGGVTVAIEVEPGHLLNVLVEGGP